MSGYAHLTDEETELLKAIPLTAGAIVVTLDDTGLTAAGREMLAAARVVAEGVHRHPGNPLVVRTRPTPPTCPTNPSVPPIHLSHAPIWELAACVYGRREGTLPIRAGR